MGIEVPLRLAELMPPINKKESCLQFVRFREAVKKHRSACDDNIRQRLSSIQRPSQQCPKFAENLKRAQESRWENLKFCLSVLEEEQSLTTDASFKSILRKEKDLLEAELVVEDIVCEQSRILFDNKYSPGHLKMNITCYTVLYCPVEECEVERPFSDSFSLFKHLQDAHQITVYDEDGVAPFLDQYLKRYPNLKGPSVLGGESDGEDAQIRQELHMKMLNTLLERQLLERSTVHKRPRACLFCLEQSACMSELFDHMYREHRFNIGLLDNLINADSFLNELDEMLKLKKQCIYCGEVFRNGTCLRKHLKSKNHFKIDSKDSRWDKYYLVNYVNISKNSVRMSSAVEEEVEDDTWDDLVDEVEVETQCLFCSELLVDPESCFEHMHREHSFNFVELQLAHELDYYSSMKLLNFLRHCQTSDVNPFGQNVDAEEFFSQNKLPDPSLWNKPEFLFPVYEEDPLLTAIDVE